ncbi:3-deoxy-D-manno-octulosonic acid transferase [Pontimicrobium sp. IMCC45349]|uniref:3-deoxy-D-manno-octulosonic acid transferase n=1 Tax=Pontimicrobium sp. IMCC45349 TaxID=3391574 RepID=UPI00399F760F
MHFLYNILIVIVSFFIKLIATFNAKLKLGVIGRTETFSKLKKHLSKNDNVIWLHCASLGEYEQGLPVFEKLKDLYPKHKFVLSFFSPSGYEIRKTNPITDIVVYLPFDTKRNAIRFLNIVNPSLVIFVKYEIWPNYFLELEKRKIKTLLISAYFRKDQIFFKPYGGLMRKSLKTIDHFFVQDENSQKLLHSLNIHNVSVSGDTRFDRVSNQLNIDNTLKFIEEFKNNKLCFVAGSVWPEDEAIFLDYINSSDNDLKFILAPHDIKSTQINNLKHKISKSTVLFSEMNGVDLKTKQVFIIDTIGILSKIYSYADIAYVGGAMGKSGLHNTLEPATFGVPVIIGKNYKNFPEAALMIQNKGMFSITSTSEFNSIALKLSKNKDFRLKSGANNSNLILKNKGAVIQIIDFIRNYYS